MPQDGVVHTLLDRSDNLVTKEEDRKEEETMIQAFGVCGYPDWTVRKPGITSGGAMRKTKEEKNRGMVVLPYVQGLTKRMTRSLKKRMISVASKPHLTLRNIIVHPKDKIDPREGVYCIPYKNCIGETKRKLEVRV